MPESLLKCLFVLRESLYYHGADSPTRRPVSDSHTASLLFQHAVGVLSISLLFTFLHCPTSAAKHLPRRKTDLERPEAVLYLRRVQNPSISAPSCRTIMPQFLLNAPASLSSTCHPSVLSSVKLETATEPRVKSVSSLWVFGRSQHLGHFILTILSIPRVFFW